VERVELVEHQWNTVSGSESGWLDSPGDWWGGPNAPDWWRLGAQIQTDMQGFHSSQRDPFERHIIRRREQ
jgi:hypothetical protein